MKKHDELMASVYRQKAGENLSYYKRACDGIDAITSTFEMGTTITDKQLQMVEELHGYAEIACSNNKYYMQKACKLGYKPGYKSRF